MELTYLHAPRQHEGCQCCPPNSSRHHTSTAITFSSAQVVSTRYYTYKQKCNSQNPGVYRICHPDTTYFMWHNTVSLGVYFPLSEIRRHRFNKFTPYIKAQTEPREVIKIFTFFTKKIMGRHSQEIRND